MERFYYRIEESSSSGKRMKDLLQKAVEVTEKASRLSEALGAVEFTASPGFAFGSIGSLIFNKVQNSRQYELIGKRGGRYEYIPNMRKAKGKAVAKTISTLPAVKLEEVSKALGLELKKGDKMPGWFNLKGTIYISSSTPIEEEDYQSILSEDYLSALKERNRQE